MYNIAVGIWLCLLMLSPLLGIRLNPCELAGQLYILDVPKAELSKWLCIADFESRFNTHVVGQANLDGSKDYGLFQISDRFWCAPPTATPYYAFNGCNINCTELLSDDITSAVRCARLIRKQQGWTAWSVYPEFCNGTLTDPDDCFQQSKATTTTSESPEMSTESELTEMSTESVTDISVESTTIDQEMD
ncbi:hypothetical protein ACLKA6_019666 [Drosophila palustris]